MAQNCYCGAVHVHCPDSTTRENGIVSLIMFSAASCRGTSIDHVSSSSPIGALTQIIRRCKLRNLGNWNKVTKKLPSPFPTHTHTHTHTSRFSVTIGRDGRVTRLTLLQNRFVLSIYIVISMQWPADGYKHIIILYLIFKYMLNFASGLTSNLGLLLASSPLSNYYFKILNYTFSCYRCRVQYNFMVSEYLMII